MIQAISWTHKLKYYHFYFDPFAVNNSKAQSLMDLRCTLPGLYNPHYSLEHPTAMEEMNLMGSGGRYNNKNTPSPPIATNQSTPKSLEPIYCSIEPKQQLPPPQNSQVSFTEHHSPEQDSVARANSTRGPHPLPAMKSPNSNLVLNPSPALARNCISLENLDNVGSICWQSDLTQYHNYNLQQQQQYYLAMLNLWQNQQQQQAQPQFSSNIVYRRPVAGDLLYPAMTERQLQQLQLVSNIGGFGYANYTNPYITANSKLSLGNESDDYRRYRDVAL